MESADEAKRVFEISVRKLEGIRVDRVSKSLHKNLLVHSIFNRVLPLVSDAEECSDFAATSDFVNEIEVSAEGNTDNDDDKHYIVLENAPMTSGFSNSYSVPPSTVPDGIRVADEQKNAIISPIVVPSQTNNSNDENSQNETRTLKRRADFDEHEHCSKRYRYNACIETSDSNWRSTVDTFDLDEESDVDIDIDTNSDGDGTSPVPVHYVFHDENIVFQKPMDGQQISGLITVFSSSFSGLGELDEGKVVVKSCDNQTVESWPLRRANSMPNLSSKTPERKRKNSPVLIRL